MDWRALLLPREKPVAVGLIGLGSFGLSFLRQSLHVPGMSVVALCDADGEGGLAAAAAAGLPRPTICETAAAAQRILEQGELPLLVDGAELPFSMLDAVVEASGAPEAGARHAEAALRNGCHLVLVNKETACTAGPALAAMARANGLVYSMADGDQPAMVLEMVQWARVLGLDVVCAGKAGEADVPEAEVASDGSGPVSTTGNSLVTTVRNRSEHIPLQQRVRVPDIAEMAIVINETGFGWNSPGLFGPAMHYAEMASVLRHVDDGGLLDATPTVEIANLITHPRAPSMAGGVFIVIRARTGDDWSQLAPKRHLMSPDGRHILLWRPYHLLGLETSLSVLAAVLLGVPTSGRSVEHRVDVVARTEAPFHAGQVLSMDRAHCVQDLKAELAVPQSDGADTCVPYYVAAGRSMLRDVPAGRQLRWRDVDIPSDSSLCRLRRGSA